MKKEHHFLCIKNAEYPLYLVVGKIYKQIPDERGNRDKMIRIVDEEGESALFPLKFFAEVELPAKISRALKQAELR